MNKKQKIIKESETYKKYHIPNLRNYMRRQKNCVIIHTANGLPHEIEKLKVCYEIQKEGHKFITEAQRNDSKIIVDVVDLTDGEEYEVVDKHGDIERYQKEKVNIRLVDEGPKKNKKNNKQTGEDVESES